jgi:hypothetical protein
LDDAASAAARGGRNGEAGVLGDLARTLRNELDQHVPSYQQRAPAPLTSSTLKTPLKPVRTSSART